MRRLNRWGLAPAFACLLIGATTANAVPILPDFGSATFDNNSSKSTHRYFPLMPGTLTIYEGSKVEDGETETERVETVVTFNTIDILGVSSRVVRSDEYINDQLVEIAFDWYAQDTDGNVWYMGEDVINYEYDDDDNVVGTNDDGSWKAGENGAVAGFIMKAALVPGDSYFQEAAPGVAEDFAEIISLGGTVDIGFGSFDNVLVTGEGNALDGLEIVEHKIYAPDIGLILIRDEVDDQGESEFEIELIRHGSVPEPASAALVALAGTALLSRRRRWG